VGRAEVEAADGREMSLGYVEGASTTEIVDRILKVRSGHREGI
jgi:hypothetical protein